VDNTDRADFAVEKIRELYRALPRRFPRVKCINYFDGNNLEFVPDRTLNDYSVTNHPQVLAAYREAVSQPHFLDRSEPDASRAASVRLVSTHRPDAPARRRIERGRPVAMPGSVAAPSRAARTAAPLATLPPTLLWIGAGMLLLAGGAVWQIVALIRLGAEAGGRSRTVVLRAID
jgi:hypothetical protein